MHRRRPPELRIAIRGLVHYTGFMSFAPKHDFPRFDRLTAMARLELARQATPTQKVERFAELVAVGMSAEKPQKTRQQIQQRWLAEKVARRLRQIAAFADWDIRR